MANRVRRLGSLCFLTLGLLVISLPEPGLTAQPGLKKMRDEEEEPEKSKVPAKVEDLNPKEARPLPLAGKFNFGQEVAKARHPLVKGLLKRLAVPYDNLVAGTGKTYRIALFAERTLPDGKFSYLELDASLAKGKEKELATGVGFILQPYEEIVLEDIDSFLKQKIDLNRDDIVELCVQILQETRRFHASAVDQKKRIGKEWEAVDEKLRKRIVQIRRDQLKRYVEAKDWKKADELSNELSNYSDDPEAQKDIYRLLLLKEVETLNSDRDEDFIKLRDAVNQFETIGGGSGEPLAQTARSKLRQRAQRYVEEAKILDKQTQAAEAFNRLRSAEAIDPDLPAIQELRTTLRDRILYVGVSRLPDRLSPATARTDPERWAVDLLFESVLQSIPDLELGRHYRPVLAASMPSLVPMGRDFSLMRNARWAQDYDKSGKTVTAHDVFGTLELLKQIPTLPCAEGIDLLDTDKIRIDDPYKLRLSFRQGVLEPLNLATFKVLPARYLKDQKKEANDDLFGTQPFGSGPYRYVGREREGEREVAVFRANPYYSQRPGRYGLPRIREIRFVVPKLSDPAADVASGQLHLVLDVPTGDLQKYTTDPRSSSLVKADTPALNRRIWMLAINHRRTVLQDVSLRRGLSAAIDRESILNVAFRTGGVKNHRVLPGPFPPNSWATPERARKPEAALFNRDLANGLLSEATAKGRVELTLKYPEGDPRAELACSKIKEQIEEASKKANNTATVGISLKSVPVDLYSRQIDQEHDFDLAYVPFDYKDDLFWLGGLFDRSAGGMDGRNFLGYLVDGSNPAADDNALRIALDEIRAHRDFRDRVRDETWKFHAKFLGRMPFVPLWQLDRHLIVHKSLEMFLDDPNRSVSPSSTDPASVFTGVEFWRLK